MGNGSGEVSALVPRGQVGVYMYTSVDLSIKWTGSNSGIDNDSGIEVAELDQHSTDQVTGSTGCIGSLLGFNRTLLLDATERCLDAAARFPDA